MLIFNTLKTAMEANTLYIFKSLNSKFIICSLILTKIFVILFFFNNLF